MNHRSTVEFWRDAASVRAANGVMRVPSPGSSDIRR
jgi:hypothetical protein